MDYIQISLLITVFVAIGVLEKSYCFPDENDKTFNQVLDTGKDYQTRQIPLEGEDYQTRQIPLEDQNYQQAEGQVEDKSYQEEGPIEGSYVYKKFEDLTESSYVYEKFQDVTENQDYLTPESFIKDHGNYPADSTGDGHDFQTSESNIVGQEFYTAGDTIEEQVYQTSEGGSEGHDFQVTDGSFEGPDNQPSEGHGQQPLDGIVEGHIDQPTENIVEGNVQQPGDAVIGEFELIPEAQVDYQWIPDDNIGPDYLVNVDPNQEFEYEMSKEGQLEDLDDKTRIYDHEGQFYAQEIEAYISDTEGVLIPAAMFPRMDIPPELTTKEPTVATVSDDYEDERIKEYRERVRSYLRKLTEENQSILDNPISLGDESIKESKSDEESSSSDKITENNDKPQSSDSVKPSDTPKKPKSTDGSFTSFLYAIGDNVGKLLLHYFETFISLFHQET